MSAQPNPIDDPVSAMFAERASMPSSPLRGTDSGVLRRLEAVRDRILAAECERDDLILEAIEEKYSEREIGAAAGMSGPAIHYRKVGVKLGERQRP